MAIFQSNLEALIYIILIAIGLYLVSRIISYSLERIKRIIPTNKNRINFIIRLITILVVVYFIFEGFPSFKEIPPEYTVIITGLSSTALALATSEIFSNFISGILIWFVDPFDIGDVVKVKDFKGVIKSITLTKVIIETFDRIIIEISNSDILESTILNYTLELKNIENYYKFVKQIQSPQQIGNAILNIDVFDDLTRKKEENELKMLHELVIEKEASKIHIFTFPMQFSYEGFRIKVDKIKKLCDKYKELFDFTPKFHIYNFDYEIHVKFRIITLNADKLLNYQANFANDIYKIII